MYCRAAFLCFLLLTACQKKAENTPPPRYAVLRFENLSGDPALDWTGRAISESLPTVLAGALDGPVLGPSALNRLAPGLGLRPVSAPGVSSERAAAILAGANRAIAGYIERTAGRIRITATVEDLSSGKSLRVVTAEAASPMAALEQLSSELSPRARHLPTSNADAFHSWALALEAPSAASVDLLEQAIRLDPDFGAAWVVLAARDLALGNRAAAQDVIEHARQRKVDEVTRANLDLAAADLSENRTARITALRKVSSLSPADIVLLRTLAEAETAVGQFAAAASDWKKLTEELPTDPAVWNSLGYARSYAGDYAGALPALREYERLRPRDANPSDSIGDLNYSFRKFSEAAASYLEAYKKQPDFQQAGDLYKAAWAKFRGGDKTGADALFAQFRAARVKARPADGLIELLASDWLYRTGREPEAIAALRKVVGADAYAQLTIWDLLRGDRAQALKDAVDIGPKVTTAPVFLARFAAQPSAPAAEWEMRAERTIPPSAMALRQSALGYALLLDGKREAALPIWEHIADLSPATDFFSRAVYARLQGKTLDRPLLPDPNTLNQFAAIVE